LAILARQPFASQVTLWAGDPRDGKMAAAVINMVNNELLLLYSDDKKHWRTLPAVEHNSLAFRLC